MNHRESQVLMIQESLYEWYEKYGRHTLPWRNTDNIYHIYLSEVMLQQTQVSRVLEEYYPRFLERFPSLATLRSTPLEDVLALWSGLGYYLRARNLHRVAGLVEDRLSDDFDTLCKLPGIGEYTASAICSFGYHQPIVVVDTNIARVLKRFFGITQSTPQILKHYGSQLLDHTDSKKHNLALMDLGSLLCTPLAPACESCPLEVWCVGKEDPLAYTKTKKILYESLELFYGVLIRDHKIALVESSGPMYKKMLLFPAIDPVESNLIATYSHSYTKYRLTVKLYTIDEEGLEAYDDIVWISLDTIEQAPIASLIKKGLYQIKNLLQSPQ